MKSLMQQMATAFSLTLVVMAIAVCAPDQAVAQVRGRMRAHNTGTREFDKGYLPPNASRRYTGTTAVNQGTLNHLSFNGGAGNDTIGSAKVQPQTAKPNRVVGDWNGDGVDRFGSAKVQPQNKAAQPKLLDGNDGGIWRTTNARRNSATKSR